MKKWLAAALAMCMTASLCACGNDSAASTTAGGTDTAKTTAAEGAQASGSGSTAFPEHDINGWVMWGAGGGTDNIVRPLCTYTEKILGKSIVVNNKTGATGAVATQFVHDQAADGYSLLLGAENPALYKILGISELTYDNFDPVLLIGNEELSLVVAPDSPYETVTDLVNAAKADPESVIMATTGDGGSQWEAAAFIKAVTGAEFTQLPFDGDASALTAVMGGNAHFTTIKSTQAIEANRAGTIKILATLTKEPVEALEGSKPITEEYPGFEEYLPFGPFYGVWVKEGTPEEVTKALSDAFQEGFENSDFQELLTSMNINPLGLTGEEANTYIAQWQKSAATALYRAGVIEKSPEELGIQ